MASASLFRPEFASGFSVADPALNPIEKAVPFPIGPTRRGAAGTMATLDALADVPAVDSGAFGSEGETSGREATGAGAVGGGAGGTGGGFADNAGIGGGGGGFSAAVCGGAGFTSGGGALDCGVGDGGLEDSCWATGACRFASGGTGDEDAGGAGGFSRVGSALADLLGGGAATAMRGAGLRGVAFATGTRRLGVRRTGCPEAAFGG